MMYITFVYELHYMKKKKKKNYNSKTCIDPIKIARAIDNHVLDIASTPE